MAMILKALTLETQSGMHAKEIRIDHFPLRVGRENRGPYASMRRMGERRSGGQGQTNDLYLWDSGEEYYISQRHFSIEKENDRYFLVDQCSAMGTWVEGRLVGGQRTGGKTEIFHGDIIIPAAHLAGFVFKVLIERDAPKQAEKPELTPADQLKPSDPSTKKEPATATNISA